MAKFIIIAVFLLLSAVNTHSEEKIGKNYISTFLRNDFNDEQRSLGIGFSTEYRLRDEYDNLGIGLATNFLLSNPLEADLGLRFYYHGFKDMLLTFTPSYRLLFYDDTVGKNEDGSANYDQTGVKGYAALNINVGVNFNLNNFVITPIMGIETFNGNTALLLGIFVSW